MFLHLLIKYLWFHLSWPHTANTTSAGACSLPWRRWWQKGWVVPTCPHWPWSCPALSPHQGCPQIVCATCYVQMGHHLCLHGPVCGALEVHPQLIPEVKPFFLSLQLYHPLYSLGSWQWDKNIVGTFGVEHSWVVGQVQGAWLLKRAFLGAQGCPVGCRIPPNLLDHACCTAELLQTHFGVICWNWGLSTML